MTSLPLIGGTGKNRALDWEQRIKTELKQAWRDTFDPVRERPGEALYGHGVAHLHFGGGNRHTLMNNSSGFAGCINPGRDTFFTSPARKARSYVSTHFGDGDSEVSVSSVRPFLRTQRPDEEGSTLSTNLSGLIGMPRSKLCIAPYYNGMIPGVKPYRETYDAANKPVKIPKYNELADPATCGHALWSGPYCGRHRRLDRPSEADVDVQALTGRSVSLADLPKGRRDEDVQQQRARLEAAVRAVHGKPP
jgi:hypothetical protein